MRKPLPIILTSSTVRFYNADGFDSLFGEKLVGARHAEDGRPYSEDEADYLL